MAAEVVLPRQGWTMEVGSIVEWLKRDGDKVEVGDVLFTLQSDKAVNEIEALDAGVLRIPADSPAPGVEVPIGTVLAYILEPGEEMPVGDRPADGARPDADRAVLGAHPPTLEDLRGPSAPESPTGASPLAPAGPRDGAQPAISPRARRIAGELGVDWAALRGSGLSGRIVERDVRAAAEAPAHRPAAVAAPVRPPAVAAPPRPSAPDWFAPEPPRVDIQPLTGVRRVVAARMAQSAREVPAVTLTTEADATELVALRERVRADSAGTELIVPTYNDCFARILAAALAEQPELNASWTEAGIVRHGAVNVGVAVETERGLLVPVVRDVGSKSLRALATELAGLVERARSGAASADDLSGGTITITNLGRYEIDAFTPIVNPPEAAILGVGRIVARPVVVDEASERVEVRKMVALSLTFDHRIVDGAPAARFLQRVKHLVERPHRWALG